VEISSSFAINLPSAIRNLNELAVAEERRAEWCLFRLWNLSRELKAFELRPPLDAHVALAATTYQASFH